MKEYKVITNNTKALVIVLLLIGLIIGFLGYVFFVKNNVKIGEQVTYKSLNGEEIKLAIYGTPEEDIYGKIVETKYKLYKNNTVYDVKEGYWDRFESNKFIVSNDKIFYLLDDDTKQIIAYYVGEDSIIYNSEEMADDSKDYCIVISTIGKNDASLSSKIALVVNTINDNVIKFESNNPDKYAVNNNNIYFQKDSEIYQYDIKTGSLLKSMKYDSIIDTTFVDFASITSKDNNYYYVDVFNDFKETKLIKFDTYSNNNEKLEIYKLNNEKYFYYENSKTNDKYFSKITSVNELDKEDDTYAIYTAGAGMCGANILVNKKTKKLEGFDANYNFVKGNEGYYLFHSECVTDWGNTYAYTTSWKLLGESFIRNGKQLDNNGNIYVANNGYVELKNINGELINKSKYYSEIGGGILNGNTLYVITRDFKTVYLVSLNIELKEQFKTQIKTTTYNEFFPYLELDNGVIKISIMTSDGDENHFEYNPFSQSIEQITDIE